MESLPTTDRASRLPEEMRIGAMDGAEDKDRAEEPDAQTHSPTSPPVGVQQDVANASGIGFTRPFSFFAGLRVILLLYAAIAVVAAFGYEIWCLLRR
jgi:hypothetical protein